jgi:peptidoglycan/xylan/chitin deacetylase (PgdA/CDA1 family)
MVSRRLLGHVLTVFLSAGMLAAAAPGAQAATAACPPAPFGVHWTAPGAGRTVALTFDDGPGRSTGAVLRTLEGADIGATFFNIGVNERAQPATVVAEAGHRFLLGDHTWSHRDLARLPAAAQAEQMDEEIAEQRSITGSPPCVFRPPYGSYDRTTLTLAQARRMTVWNWSVDTEDWKARGSSSPFWVDRIISRAEAGGAQAHPVVLMHNAPAGDPATAAALPTIIRFYRDRGYAFVDLDGRVRRS